jgi:uncharacterized protein YyaL (SSP411 family)
MDSEHTYTNLLIKESSPYLLQHAHNPVNWQAWTEAAWEEARVDDKLVLISVGYSACHWCHVMEHESFEDEAVAKIMNEHFVCIKVDREERPDVDQIYMTAVQLMTGHGGWPLNCFATPEGQPVYGGTYFPKEKWMNVLFNLSDLWRTEPGKVYEYAEELTRGVLKSELIVVKNEPGKIQVDTLVNSWKNWAGRIDTAEGGPNKAPKFPLPNNYLFLLHLGQSTLIASSTREEINRHVRLTLRKMAFGGIYDQLGGGFARYSTDILWKVPHFEKMLYDNALLVSLYCEAWLLNPDPLYRQIVYETLDFVTRELRSPEGAFYSALDADSEGVEGKYYVWTEAELKLICGTDFPLFATYYSINHEGLWEQDEYILLRKEEEQAICLQFNLSESQLREKITHLKNVLLHKREERIRPGLDDKSLASWNALMTSAWSTAYRVFAEPRFLQHAKETGELLLQKMRKPDGGLFHTYKNGKAAINGFLEDYCFTMEALIALYEVTFDERWLKCAVELCEYTLLHFYDAKSGFFYFTSSLDPALIARKFELSDNVTPASNSSMAKCLFLLGHFMDRPDYILKSEHMIGHLQQEMEHYGAGYSNWGILQLRMLQPFLEIAIVGKDVDENRALLQQHYFPNVIFAGSGTSSTLPLLKDRFKEGQTLIYVCREKTCLAPVSDLMEALKMLHENYEV